MKKLEKERLKNNAKTQLRRRATRSTLDMRGVLTVTVHRCINLEARLCRDPLCCARSCSSSRSSAYVSPEVGHSSLPGHQRPLNLS